MIKITHPGKETNISFQFNRRLRSPPLQASRFRHRFRDRQGTTILLVEDDEIMRSLTRQLLQEHGYAVVEADDGKSALEWMKSHPDPIDLLLTDVVMRRMSGPELVDRLNASHPDLKVVYMSGYTGELIAEREVLKRGIMLLEKPFTRTALLNTIHTTLG